MLRTGALSSWHPQGYVCLSCQRQKLAIRTARLRLEKHVSTSAHASNDYRSEARDDNNGIDSEIKEAQRCDSEEIEEGARKRGQLAAEGYAGMMIRRVNSSSRMTYRGNIAREGTDSLAERTVAISNGFTNATPQQYTLDSVFVSAQSLPSARLRKHAYIPHTRRSSSTFRRVSSDNTSAAHAIRARGNHNQNTTKDLNAPLRAVWSNSSYESPSGLPRVPQRRLISFVATDNPCGSKFDGVAAGFGDSPGDLADSFQKRAISPSKESSEKEFEKSTESTESTEASIALNLQLKRLRITKIDKPTKTGQSRVKSKRVTGKADSGRRSRKLLVSRKHSSTRDLRQNDAADGTAKARDQSINGKTLEEAMGVAKKRKKRSLTPLESTSPTPIRGDNETPIEKISPSTITVQPLNVPQLPVPFLSHGLDRVLFNRGIYQLQDPTSRVYNFDPYLQKIMPVAEFDFNALKTYKTSSQDQALAALATEHDKKYIGSTSSMTGVLTHFHYLLSNFRPINFDMLSIGFSGKAGLKTNFTPIAMGPSAIFLRWKNGTYAIDADKEFDSANVLMLLGKSMELMLTLPKSEYERYRKSDPRKVPEEQKAAPETYQYTTSGDFLMRSQLDAYDPRLPDNGTFDLKTRAVVSVRMDAGDYEPMTGYELYTLQGKWTSYEREYHDMLRATMIKYMLQARMGRMNGIFVAYHNVKRIFGFQYIPMEDMDRALHGQLHSCLGDQEFKASLELLNKLLDKATAKFPEQSLRLHFEAQKEGKSGKVSSLHVFAEPMTEEEIDTIQGSQRAKIAEFERKIMGIEVDQEEDVTSSPTPVTDDIFHNMNSGSALPSSVESDVGVTSSSAIDLVEEQVASELNSSDSNADDAFLSSMDSDSSDSRKQLFHASITLTSKVNGEETKENRPRDLAQEDTWTIEYQLQEHNNERIEWAEYEAMKARRKDLFSGGRDDESIDDEDASNKGKVVDYYIEFLRGMSEKGRRERNRLDLIEEGNTPVVVGEPLTPRRESIEDVEEYVK